MIEETLERIAKALERIAENNGNTCEPAATSAVVQANVGEDPDLGMNAETPSAEYPKPDDREGWLKLCKERGLKVPSGTRTTTLEKMVMGHDSGANKKVDTQLIGSLDETPGTLDAGSAQDVDNDPLGVDTPTPEEKKITVNDIRALMHEYMTAKGKTRESHTDCVGLILTFGKASNLDSVLPENLTPLYNEIQKQLIKAKATVNNGGL